MRVMVLFIRIISKEALPKRRPRKGAKEDEVVIAPNCIYEKKIGPPKVKEEAVERTKPDPEKTRTMVEAVA